MFKKVGVLLLLVCLVGSSILPGVNFVRAEEGTDIIASSAVITDSISMEYGDVCDLNEVIQCAEGYTGVLEYAVNSYDEVLSLNGSILEGISVGESTLFVTVGADETYETEQVEIPVTVTKRNLGTIASDQITWRETEKTYDTIGEKQVFGSFSGLKEDEIEFSATAVFPGSVGMQNSTVKDIETINTRFDNLYNYIIDEENGPQIVIRPYEISVEVSDLSVIYTSQKWKNLNDGNFPDDVSAESMLSVPRNGMTQAVSDDLDQYMQENPISGFVSIDLSLNNLDVGIHNDAFLGKLVSPEYGNYRIQSIKNGSLSVLPENTTDDATAWDRVVLDESSSSGVYQKDKTVYIRNNGIAVFDVADKSFYDTVVIDSGSGEVLGYISPSEYTQDTVLDGEFYLQKSGTATRTDADADASGMQNNKIPSGAIYVDVTAPTVDMEDISSGEDLSFTKYWDEPHQITVTSDDEGSGLNQLRYKIISVSKTEDLKQRIEKEAEEYSTWNKIDSGEVLTVPPAREDGYYLLLVAAEDNVGNIRILSSTGLVIDTVEPSITHLPESENGDVADVGLTEASRVYHSSPIKDAIRVEENNFDASLVDISVAATDNSGADVVDEVYPVDSYADHKSLNAWEEVGNVNTYQMPIFSRDGNYVVGVSAKDKTGNEALSQTIYFTIDQTAPEGKISVRADDDEIASNDGYDESIFTRHVMSGLSVSVSAFDKTAGVKEVSYYIDEVDDKAKSLKARNISELADLSFAKVDGDISIPINKSVVIYAKIEDMSGNVSFLHTDRFITDNTEPDVSIQVDTATVHKGDVPVIIEINDPVRDAVFSGLHDIHVQVLKDSVVTQQYDYEEEFESAESLVSAATKDISISAKDNNSNDVRVRVIAKDNAENEISVTSDPVAIDTTLPVIDAAYDNNSAEHGWYFKDDRILTISFGERNFVEENTYLRINVNDVSYDASIDDIRKGRVPGVRIVEEAQDNMRGKSRNEYTDDRVVVYRVGFAENADVDYDFAISPYTIDAAGNETDVVDYGSSVAPTLFVVDKVAPVIRVSYLNGDNATVEASLSQESPLYDQRKITATVNIQERNFSKDDVLGVVESWDYNKNALNAYTSVATLNTGSWSILDNNVNSFTMPDFIEDANYSLAVAYTDLAGNAAVSYAPHYFTVDKTAPVGSLTVSAKEETKTYSTFTEWIRFVLFDNKEIPVTYTMDDTTSGVASVSYYIHVPDVETRGSFSGIAYNALAGLEWTPWESSLSIRPDQQAVVYMRIVDMAGNTTYINSEDGVIADATSPSAPEINITAEAPQYGIYNADVPISISVTDPAVGGTYSGLKTVAYTIESNGQVTQSGNYNSELATPENRVQSISHAELISSSGNNTNQVVIRVNAEDYAGNTSSAEKSLSIDVTKPEIEVVYDRNDPVNEKYYNTTRTATIRVRERNFDPDLVTLDITSSGEMPQVSAWTVSSETGTSDAATNIATITYSADADYRFTMSVRDKAGNETKYDRTDEFTIDKTKPRFTVTYDNNSSENEKYYKNGRTATLQITEHNFNAADVRVAIEAKAGGVEKNPPSVSAWNSNGDVRTATIPFLSDGEYAYTIRYTDLADNAMDEYIEGEFVIDTANPELKIAGVESQHAYNGAAIPIITGEDTNIDTSTLAVFVEGVTHKTYAGTGSDSTTENSIVRRLPDFKHTKDTDDIYTVRAVLSDLAGNQVEKKVVFSVNRFGSTYSFDKGTAALMKEYYLSEEEPVVIHEVNVDVLQNQDVVVAKDGVVKTLKSGIDYTIERKVEKDSWKEYIYTIKKENFAEEGLYEVIVQSDDKAGNSQNNKIKEYPVSFAVDKTPPTATIAGIEDNGRYREISHAFSVYVEDNIRTDTLELRVNDKLVGTYSREELDSSNGKIDYEIQEASEWQTITAIARDAAGNAGNAASCSVLLTSSLWQQMIHSKAFVPACIAAAVGAAGILFLLWKKRRKDES